MHSAGVVLVVVLLAWGSSALPCDTCWSGTETEVVGDVLPAEEIVFVPVSDEEQIVSDPQPNISDSSSDESQSSGDIVEPPSGEEIFSVALCQSNPETCAVDANGPVVEDDSSEEVGPTTEKV